MNSRIYKELSSMEIDRVITDLYGNNTKITECRIMKGGLFNTTYYIATDADAAGIVLRVAPVNKHLLFEYEKTMMSAEPLFHRLLSEKQVPTSKILKYSAAGDVIEREYIISKYIPSVPMNDPSLEGQDLDYLYEQAGALARKIHEITGDKFGWKRPDGLSEYETWSEFVFAFAEEAAEKAGEHKLFTAAEINIFKTVFTENADVLDEIKTPFMTHTDLWQGNILLSEISGRHEISGIIDLDRTIFGDKYWDLSNPWIINAPFLKGYADDEYKGSNYNKRQFLYKLLGGFFGCYVVLIEYDDNVWFENEKAACVSLLRTI